MDAEVIRRPTKSLGPRSGPPIPEPPHLSLKTVSPACYVDEFLAAIHEAGIAPPATVEADGELHRFSSNGKPGDAAGWYVLFGDGLPAGAFGCWRTGVTKKWRADGNRRLSRREEVAFRERMVSIKRERNAEDEKSKAKARERAKAIWEAGTPATEGHPYLTAKGIEPHGVRVAADENLVVPVTDGTVFHSLQFIPPTGEPKRFLAGGRKRGCYFGIGKPGGVIYICEGFATGASIRQATGQAVAVAFDAGNIQPVAEDLRARYPDEDLVICADDDADKTPNTGMTVSAVAAQAVTGRVALPDFGKERPEGVSDFNDLHQFAGLETVRRCIETADSVAEEWPEPQPLPDLTPDVEPFDLQLLPKAFGRWVEDVSERMQAPPDYAAVGLMVALGAVVGRQVAIRPKAVDVWDVVPNLWGGIVGRPGVLKTPSLREALRPLNKLEANARKEHEEALAHLKAEKLVAEARVTNAKLELKTALRDGKDAHAIAKAALEAPEEGPPRRRYLVHDSTVEKLGEILADNPRGVMVFRDELTGWLRSLDRQGRDSDRAFFLEAWDGTEGHSCDRIGRGSLYIEAACVSLLGGIQPGPLSVYMSRAVKGGGDDDGLVQRFQMFVWPDISGTWVNVDRAPDSDARAEAYAAFERLDSIDLLNIGAEIPKDDKLPFLRFSGEAQEVFTEFRAELESRLRNDDLPPIVEAHLAKYRSLVPSLALLIFLADGKTGPVDSESLLRACGWAEYLESHARRIYAPALAPTVAAAVPLSDHIKRGDLGKEFSVAQVQQKGWSNLTDKDQVVEALELLVDLDWLRILHDRNTGGRPKTRYLVNPALKGD